MRRLFLLLLLAGCPSEKIDEQAAFCDSGLAEAVNPFSGECVTFASPCDVPVEWQPCGGVDLACASDDECSATQHCTPGEDAGAPSCADNPVCRADSDCDVPAFVCDFAARDDENPSVPEGLCARQDAGQPSSPEDMCVVNSQCGELEICPAQYGGCSEGEPRDVACPSHCEPACLVDEDGQGEGEICNAPDICGEANGEGDSPPLVCSGWCVPA